MHMKSIALIMIINITLFRPFGSHLWLIGLVGSLSLPIFISQTSKFDKDPRALTPNYPSCLAQSPAEGRGHIDGIGQCFVSSTPGGQALFPLPLLGLNTRTRPGD